MATSDILLDEKEWKLISSVSVRFQVQGQSKCYIIEAATAPDPGDISIKKEASPGKMYAFEKVDGNFYAYGLDKSTEISIDPIAP